MTTNFQNVKFNQGGVSWIDSTRDRWIRAIDFARGSDGESLVSSSPRPYSLPLLNMNWNSAELPDVSTREPHTRCVRWGDTVRVAFMAWLEDETLIYSSIGGEPPIFTAGSHSVLPGIERLVIGMRVGESKTEKISPDSAFGPYSPELSCWVSRRWFQAQKIEPQVGLGLDVRKTDGTLVRMIITELDGDHVTVDANHRVAGKDLLVQLDLLEILNQAESGVHATPTLETWRKRWAL